MRAGSLAVGRRVLRAGLAALLAVVTTGTALAQPSASAAASGAATAGRAIAPGSGELADCRVGGVRSLVLCGSIERPLDPERRDGPRLTIAYAVVPALARNKLPDPVFMLAGGPGQSAIALVPTVMPLFARLNNRRDIVFVDQRGTGRSAPLACRDPEDETLAEQSEPQRQERLVAACKAELLKQPWLTREADLGYFSTWIAVRDLDAVRARLGAERINLVGGSYGTRVALDYLRQFPDRVRRAVIDGVAPPDMALPASFSTDAEAAWQGLVAACTAEPACRRSHPDLGGRLRTLLSGLPREVAARHALTGREERFTLTRDMVLSAVRGALYAPALAAALPEAIDRAAAGEYEPLVGLGATLLSRRSSRLALGMHLSVVCAEDLPRVGQAVDPPGAAFADVSRRQYERLCAVWPRGPVPPAFYGLATTPAPVLVLSGGLDPVTPPRHGERVARALGPKARHVVVANAGHGVMAVGCMRDVLHRFLHAKTDADAQAVEAGCARDVPRPPTFRSIGAAVAAGASAPAASAASSAPAASRSRR